MSAPFDKLSEAFGVPIADEAASMMVTRYLTAAEISEGKRVLELACASGPGLGLLARRARMVVGADVNAAMLSRARQHYRGAVPLVQLSAESLPFADGSFDVVIFLEASYYVPHLDRVLAEIERVLTSRGRLLLVNANPERADFIRSPFSHRYHSADEFRDLLQDRGFHVKTSAAFVVEDSNGTRLSLRSRMMSFARQSLERLHLVPRTLEGRAWLKRLLGQKLRYVPGEIDERFAPRAPLVDVPPGAVRGFKVIYVSAERAP